MAYSWSSPSPTIPVVADHRYSSLHQERSYLLSALAAEESRAEYMVRALERTKAKLQTAREEDGSAEAIADLRKAAAAITRKLKKCQKSERAMVNNLAAVTTRMQMLEQHQWRKAQFEYSQRMQQTSMYGMALGLQEMTLGSPTFPAYGYPCTPYPPTTYTLSPLSGALPSMPATPFLQPQPMVDMDNAWNTPLPTPCYEPFQTQNSMSTPFITPQYGMSLNWESASNHCSPHAIPTEPFKKGRRMSLPDPPRKGSWYTTGSLGGIGEEMSHLIHDDSLELGRRLSMVSGTCASLRLQRLSK